MVKAKHVEKNLDIVNLLVAQKKFGLLKVLHYRKVSWKLISMTIDKCSYLGNGIFGDVD